MRKTSMVLFVMAVVLVACEEQLPDVKPPPIDTQERALGLRPLNVQAYQSAPIIRADPIALPGVRRSQR